MKKAHTVRTNIKKVDQNSTLRIGDLVEALDVSGLANHTVFIVTSDQGYFLGEHGLYDKRWVWEESIRMPFIARSAETKGLNFAQTRNYTCFCLD